MMDDIDIEVWQDEDDPSSIQDTPEYNIGSSPLPLQGPGE
jgi:hypothetical protein